MTRVERGMSSLIMMITKQKARSGWYIIVNLPRSTTLVNRAQDFFSGNGNASKLCGKG